jgi:CubicO group peptidase (beta-lactamase class C family)
MKRRAAIARFALCIGAAISSGVASSADAQALPSPGAASAIAAVLEHAVARGDTPGVVASVVDRDGMLLEAAAGKLDVARDLPLHPDAIFNIASMTKPVTSVAIMMLREQGKLSLDDPVA